MTTNERYIDHSTGEAISQESPQRGDDKDRDPTRTLMKRLAKTIKHELKETLPRARYKHSTRVAKMCKRLCKIWGVDPILGKLAGISHDMCKGLPPATLMNLALTDGLEITPLERDKPDLLHGRAAAVLLENKYGIQDKCIRQAVAFHTFGCPDLCDLGKILFVADKIEPGRAFVTKEYLEEIYALTLDGAVKRVLIENISYIKKKNYKVSPLTLDFLKTLGNKATISDGTEAPDE